MKKIVVLTGAGISAESGIKTFREMGGLWENYNVDDVASIDGWYRNPQLVLDFYNNRRRELETVSPNIAHTILVELEKFFDITIITQNVDNLHEKAGSKNILHLHGELTKVQSTGNEEYVKDIGYNELRIGDTCPQGFQLRPHIVWFGEPVPMIQQAIEIVKKAEIFIIIGTSMNVYPAASLYHYVQLNSPIYYIDPHPTIQPTKKITIIPKQATIGVNELKELLIK